MEKRSDRCLLFYLLLGPAVFCCCCCGKPAGFNKLSAVGLISGGIVFYRSSLPVGPYLFWVLSNGYLFWCEDILRFVSYLLCACVFTCVCVRESARVWEDRDLTRMDPCLLSALDGVWQSLWTGCALLESEMIQC